MDKLKNKISYWYMRYLYITELYMVETWERHMFHVVALILLIILGLFNQILVVGGIRSIRQLYLLYSIDIGNKNVHENWNLASPEL